MMVIKRSIFPLQKVTYVFIRRTLCCVRDSLFALKGLYFINLNSGIPYTSPKLDPIINIFKSPE